MLKSLETQSNTSDRELRLFAVACWHWVTKANWNRRGCTDFANLVKQYAKGNATIDQVKEKRQSLIDVPKDPSQHYTSRSGELDMALAISDDSPMDAAVKAVSAAQDIVGHDAALSERARYSSHEAQIERAYEDASEKEASDQAKLLRTMVNPFLKAKSN